MNPIIYPITFILTLFSLILSNIIPLAVIATVYFYFEEIRNILINKLT